MDFTQVASDYEKVIHRDDIKQIEVRLVVNTFRGVEYLHLRKYYLDFNEKWCPSSEGICIPLNIENSQGLFEGLVEILSMAEVEDFLETHFKDQLDALFNSKQD